MRHYVSTDEIAAPDRFDFWRDLLALPSFDLPELAAISAIPPVWAQTRHAESFTANLHISAVPSLSLIMMHSKPLDVLRNDALVRRTDTGAFYLAVNYLGEQELVLGRQSVVLQPNDMVLLHSSQVMQTRVDPRASGLRSAMIPVDPAIVPGGVRSLRQLVGRPLSSRSGEVLLVAQHAYVLATGRVHPDDTASLSASALSLIALMLSRQLNTVGLLPVDVRRESMAVKVRTYIVANLADPGLNAEAIAAVHHISVRTLQRLFHADGVSVAAWIRRTRLVR
jgi:hypothetical protein